MVLLVLQAYGIAASKKNKCKRLTTFITETGTANDKKEKMSRGSGGMPLGKF